jgi:hypothetical protein
MCGGIFRLSLPRAKALTSIGVMLKLKRVKRRSGALIASNAYDLSPLVTFLEEIAQAYPNEFPRNVRSAKLTDEAAGEEPIKRKLVRVKKKSEV